MKKMLKAAGIAAALSVLTSLTAFAGQWQQDEVGYWYQEDDGTYPVSTWKWIDGNGDGVSECYYFDGAGYMAANTWIDGSQVNGDGAWVENGAVQVQKTWEAVWRDGTAQEVLEAVVQKNADLDRMDMDFFMNMQMGYAGSVLDVNANGNMKMINAADANMQYVMDMNMDLLGQNQHMSAFYTDGWYYYEMDGQKIKMEMPFQEALENAQTANLISAEDMPYIQDVSVVRNGDRMTIYFTADAGQLSDEVDNILNITGYSLADSGLSMGIDQYKGEFTVDAQGNYVQERVLMDMEMTSGQDTMSLHMFMEMNVKGTGDSVQLSIPSTEGYVDFNTYIQEAIEQAAA